MFAIIPRPSIDQSPKPPGSRKPSKKIGHPKRQNLVNLPKIAKSPTTRQKLVNLPKTPKVIHNTPGARKPSKIAVTHNTKRS
ncbi:hypothetical protein E2C01_016755 [Portunus trituberculatus]|uniref:Uncharacterized protein n=1 Tax=Portunus trituberculatus TaxID=210409 RepID=A0A5B7DR29_PORTR|nr:hypothetical protein [Portunus trituberculatus]